MATYQYECERHGMCDIKRPIGEAGANHPCPVCGEQAVRKFSPPMLALQPAAWSSAQERAEGSRDAPEVVTSVPPAARQRKQRPDNPALSKLPRL